MITIFQLRLENDSDHVRELFWEYLQWANAMVNRELGVSFDIKSILETDMNELGKFAPPQGRLFLAQVNDLWAGIGCLRNIREDTGEIKRMYVRPEFRNKGIGFGLLQRLLDEAQQIGFSQVRLDSAKFMVPAHALYRSVGFREIDPYPESEIPEEL